MKLFCLQKKGRNDNAIATSSVARILLEGRGLKKIGRRDEGGGTQHYEGGSSNLRKGRFNNINIGEFCLRRGSQAPQGPLPPPGYATDCNEVSFSTDNLHSKHQPYSNAKTAALSPRLSVHINFVPDQG